MSIFWMFLPVAIACGVLEGKRRGQALREQDEKRRAEEKARQEEAEAEIEALREAECKAEEAAAVWRVLMTVYTRLRQAGASVRHPWISGCIAAIEAGQDCPPEVAIRALIKTGEDLAGGRWDTDKTAEYFAEAAGRLAAMN